MFPLPFLPAQTLSAEATSAYDDVEIEADLDIDIAHCPERVLPGRALEELVQNDRIVGGLTRRAARRVAELYLDTYVTGECLLTNARTAEMCKLAENSYRDVNIAFANELSMLCDAVSEVGVYE